MLTGMARRGVATVCLGAWVLACSSGDKGAPPKTEPAPSAPAAVANTTPNAFLGRGEPTFIVGTAGDERTDRAIAGQVDLVRAIIPRSAQVLDLDVTSWPSNPVVYGTPLDNALLRREPSLPFSMTAERLEIGGETFAGPGYRLITVLPADASRPEVLVYAGTGVDGIAEINGVAHGQAPILVADAHGPLVEGRWRRNSGGALEAVLGPRARRIEWRTVTRVAAGIDVAIRFPAQLEPAPNQSEVVDALVRGIERSAARLGAVGGAPVTVYVYPDRGSVQALTGRDYDGFAVPSSRVLHMLASQPSALEHLAAHEATHLLAYARWGPAGSPLLGEGLAVWVSGRYGGRSIDDLRTARGEQATVVSLLGAGFRARPESETYPVAGLLVAALVDRLGLDAVRELYTATPTTWAAACKRAGIEPAEVDRLLTSATRR